jgi:hypothetical protein
MANGGPAARKHAVIGRSRALLDQLARMDVDQAAKAMKDAEIEDFLEDFNQPTYRGMRVNGQRVATWSSQHCLHGPPVRRYQTAYRLASATRKAKSLSAALPSTTATSAAVEQFQAALANLLSTTFVNVAGISFIG